MIDGQTKVVAQVIQECKMQDRQWGGPTHDDTHDSGDWLNYIVHQCARMARPDSSLDRDAFIKIAALAVAAVESIDRKEAQHAPNP